ncbi:MAG: CRISPR system precrRNA processing endoribonuclease RAMP protein Cas6 [Myxococcales bacterium]|nr:CRISPR system precrRNA processing endoribonuclease RAMP protein Cas6 [Myxococcales bacterium]MCB9548974.1 CRISPR system precrRNA processing endoribonuclease RAMP protein Cas6 [Myxococcales bacterium]
MNAPVGTELPLSITTLAVTLTAFDPVRLPAFAGSTLRGAVGNALRRLRCSTGLPDCDGCPAFDRCGYTQAFLGTSAGPDRPRRLAHASPPYTLTPSRWTGHPLYLQPGETTSFSLQLLGETGLSAAAWEAGIRAAGLAGLASARGRATATVATSHPWRPQLRSTGPRTVRLHLRTPLHITKDRKRLGHFDVEAFTRRLASRVEHLVDLYGEGPSPLDHATLAALAADVRTADADLAVVTDHRVSDRQGRAIPITGIVGTVTLADVPGPLRDLWRLAETLHAGKGAPMGLGHVTLEEPG